MVERERELISLADVVFTGGTSLYEAKRARSDNVHCFPSSVDSAHFRKARIERPDPADQASIPHLRLGFAGVIDERMDIDLLAELALARPDWQLVLVGPIVKIDPNHLPKLPNIHYLGSKPYAELPSYMAGWDVALLPFALNESTRFISPTKTPEYLAAGLPVVSTPIRDVVSPYGVAELAQIGSTAQDFVNAIEMEIARSASDRTRWLKRVDGFLSTMSWDRTQERMSALILAGDRERARAEGCRKLDASCRIRRAGRVALRCSDGGLICSISVSSARGSREAYWPSGSRAVEGRRCSWSRSARTLGETRTTITMTPEFSCIAMGRTSSTRTHATCSSICRGSPSGARTSTACSRVSMGSECRFPSISTR